ncbi:hypothetical protein JCM19236_6641 [Vibrio sp. JCM 19236]|nr:hypothetical protein JCM19236_6641 [Vibrio sp. JCM 19236]
MVPLLLSHMVQTAKNCEKEKVKVFADINELRLQIAKLFPNEDVEVSSVGVAVAVTGVASSDQKKETFMRQ